MLPVLCPQDGLLMRRPAEWTQWIRFGANAASRPSLEALMDLETEALVETDSSAGRGAVAKAKAKSVALPTASSRRAFVEDSEEEEQDELDEEE